MCMMCVGALSSVFSDMISRTSREGGADHPSTTLENKMSVFVHFRAADQPLRN